MKILIFGASGYAGSCIKKTLEARSHEITGTCRTLRPPYSNDASMARYELGDEKRLNELLRDINPDMILSCLTGGFDQQENAYESILRFLKEKPRGKFLFLSTSNVFDGALESAHYENDAPKAESEYGQFKSDAKTGFETRWESAGLSCEFRKYGERTVRGCKRFNLPYGKAAPF